MVSWLVRIVRLSAVRLALPQKRDFEAAVAANRSVHDGFRCRRKRPVEELLAAVARRAREDGGGGTDK